MEPMTPALPEYIRAFVYAPGTVIREYQRENRANPIPDIVQLIIRELGIPAIERYERARSRRWPYRRNLNTPRPRPLPEIDGMPDAIPTKSSRYLFYGRRYHTLPDPERYFAPVGIWDTASDDEADIVHPRGPTVTSSTTLRTESD
ncbi:hypothetical protein NMY22_g15904 [Coprinellus aureogranulatus]|nr:hypothetical protein NMY22_g15904 [Coprinellus aureogranulatus]